jgi:hypothetical protein
MFNGIGGMGKPGQRESSTKSPITEITITLKQAMWASVLLPIVAFVIYRAAIVPASRGIQEITPCDDSFIIWMTQKTGAFLVGGGFVLPYLACGVSFLIQVLDQNWPPPRSARSGERGPAMPWSGQGKPVVMEPYAAPAQATVSRRTIPLEDKPKTSPAGITSSSPSKTAQGWINVQLSSDIATEQQVQTLARGILKHHRNYSRNYWTKVGLFTDGKWRAFNEWMLERNFVYKRGNNYKLRAVGETWLKSYL